ncbi:hypothetical protein K438DRAFT_1816153 [Mycena galopus ATCC 62051]|nr:hypothetical protein K438DRAFT_1816153 [Mycena galopus ATCC 62051]
MAGHSHHVGGVSVLTGFLCSKITVLVLPHIASAPPTKLTNISSGLAFNTNRRDRLGRFECYRQGHSTGIRRWGIHDGILCC